MTGTSTLDRPKVEGRALRVAMFGNLFMAAAGVLGGLLSNSNAIMLDGLFSMIGFGSAWIALRISRNIDAGPDRLRPFGYAADEAIFSTFRALSLVGLVLFALANAARNIFNYLNGVDPEPLDFAVMAVYFTVIVLTCVILWAFHYTAWRRTGKSSAILRLESKATLFDGLITMAAGVCMVIIYYFGEGVLAPVAPIGDSLVVVLLCLFAIGTYVNEFRGGLAELAGATARPELLAIARRSLRPIISEDGGTLRDMAVTKLGRRVEITVCYDPGRQVLAEDVDRLNLRMIEKAREALPDADVWLLITKQTRQWETGT